MHMINFLILFLIMSHAVAVDSELDELIKMVKTAKVNEYRYEPCNLETEMFELQIIKTNTRSTETYVIELPRNFYHLDEFCGRWGNSNEKHPLYGWSRPTLTISLEPDVSDAGEYLIFSSQYQGKVQLMRFNGAKVVGSFNIIK